MVNSHTLFLPEKKLLANRYNLIKEKLYPLINNRNIAHLDVPCYFNIGDLLIDAGTTQFIKESHAHCIGRYSALESRHLKQHALPVNTTLLLQGGGNFGDLYPIHQKFRCEIIQQYPENPIIILPQSIHYQEHSNFIIDANIINQHRDILICARDQVSFDYLSKEISSDKICLLPDMALGLTAAMPTKKKDSNGTLFFRRRDKEIPLLNSEDPSFKDGFDWDDIITYKNERQLKRCRRALKKSNFRIIHKYGHFTHQKLRDELIQNAIQHFQKFSLVDSNRLHGLILGQLLQIPTIIRDNSYGKNSNYFNTWHNEWNK